MSKQTFLINTALQKIPAQAQILPRKRMPKKIAQKTFRGLSVSVRKTALGRDGLRSRQLPVCPDE